MKTLTQLTFLLALGVSTSAIAGGHDFNSLIEASAAKQIQLKKDIKTILSQSKKNPQTSEVGSFVEVEMGWKASSPDVVNNDLKFTQTFDDTPTVDSMDDI